MSLGTRPRRSAAGLLAGALTCAGLAVPWGPAAYAEEGACADIQEDTVGVDEVRMPSAPLEQLRVAEASELVADRGRAPGQGVGVAVVDSGIAAAAPVRQVDAPRNPAFVSTDRPNYYHGTAVAGLIAGAARPGGEAVGIAPGATLFDVRVYDAPDDSDDGELRGLTADGVVDGLRWVAAHVDSGPVPIRVVNVSLALPPSEELERVVEDLSAKDVVVVAAAGNRPTDAEDPVLGGFAVVPEPGQGEDAAEAVYPAGYDPVVAATSSVPRGVDALEYVLQNSQTDIAAPTIDGVSYAVTGVSCLLPAEAATSWAAAEVSGVLALLMSAYPDEPTERILARLYRTATGVGDLTTRLTGHGVAQPVEALTRPLTFDRRDAPDTSRTNDVVLKAQAPHPEVDVLADTRRDAVWWGLAGGGLLVVAMLLRPVLGGRRRPPQ